ncbi:MAG: sigma-54-dependent transcriptional regulator [Desulfonatronovibrionaceae bacterium]
MPEKMLIVDDEEDICFSLRGILEDEGYRVEQAPDGESALEKMDRDTDVVFLDIWLPGIDGLEVLDRLRSDFPDAVVVMISGHGNIETAVKAIKKGAFDFIEKPLSLEKVLVTAGKALEFRRIKVENRDLRSQISHKGVTDISGDSAPIRRLRQVIDRVAGVNSWVLITGENGTGKEIVARAIHARSRQASKPMVAVNCAAIPEELIESELFGHEKGAFTGANDSRRGKFEQADGGILFLDEIGDMSMKTQAKILRILQEQKFERVGGRRTIEVNVRVIAATNKDLEQEIKENRFRQDLYFRLNVFPIHVPALRERLQDIPALLQEFVHGFSEEHNFKPISFSRAAVRRLQEMDWPGNVRELKNFVERMYILYPGQEITEDILGLVDQAETGEEPRGEQEHLQELLHAGDFKEARAEFEAAYLKEKLKEFGGNISRVAEAIGLERSSLHRKLKGYGIKTG